MAPYKILKQGYIEKEPPISKRGLRKKLVRYWFVLVEDKRQVALVYFKNEDNYIARQKNEGFIKIDEAESISVIGEFMGRKNAFVIKTPKGNYTLAPESRYDLHEWLFTLHNSLETFKKKQERLKQRQGQRQRSNTIDSTSGRPQQGGGQTAHRTPPHTPTRRAPPPPTHRGTGPRKRPSRPAPVPPSGAQRHSGDLTHLSQEMPHHPLDDETPPPSYAESDVVMMSQDSYNTFGSGRHEIMDLEISHMDHDQSSSQEEQPHPLDMPHPFHQGEPPVHNRSASDSLLLMHQTSNSMPDLLQHDDETSASPEDDSHNEEGQAGESPQQARKSSGANGPAHAHTRHTRHLSLIGGLGEIKQKKKRVRRQGSLKLRSRSPPELPPPPPPEGEVPTSQEGNSPSDNGTHLTTNGLTRNELSNASLGYSGVMKTISNIEHQLDELSDEFSPKPAFPAPVRPAGAAFQFTDVRTPSPVPENPETERENFNEDEWLCDVPSDGDVPHPLPEGDHAPRGEDYGPSPQIMEDQIHHEILASPENAHLETISPLEEKSVHRKSKTVMFKEEVEDIPNTYEPCADDNVSGEEEETIPSSVAELKKKLFGDREKEAARYKKEGVLSPKFTHPENVTFEDGFRFHDNGTGFSRERSPNVNNNNSGGESEQVGEHLPANGNHGNADENNLYDKPWEQMSASKFIGTRKQPSPAQKEPTPPPVAPKPATPPNRETTPPTENGLYVQSLDRPKRSSGNESLLSSISSTLQERSKYGSDSFLSNYEPAKKKTEVKFSSKGELEKIRAAHRRDPPPPPQGASPTRQGGNSPQTKGKWASPTHQRYNGNHVGASPKRSFDEFGGPPRMAASLDALRDAKPNTQVTYDINTNSHIFRSLV